MKCEICKKDFREVLNFMSYEEVREMHTRAHQQDALRRIYNLLECRKTFKPEYVEEQISNWLEKNKPLFKEAE